MLEQLLQEGILRKTRDGRFELARTEAYRPATAGFFDSLSKSGDMWSASGWVLEPETKEPCLYVFPLQNGLVDSSVGFRRVLRPDVNDHYQLDLRKAVGFSLTFRPHPEKGPVTLMAMLPSGALVVLPGPNQESTVPEEEEIRLTEAADLEPEWRTICSRQLYAFPPDSPFQGIYSFNASFDSGAVGGVTEQFLQEADAYHQKYTNRLYWQRLLTQSLSRAGVSGAEKQRLTVLDVGCGSGNTVIPLLELLPNSKILATDISPQLLAILRNQVQDSARHRLRLIAMDATEQNFREGVLNLVVGGAILHHLSDPSQTINACYQSLKPGGHAIFFEAFEQGLVLVRLLYEQLVERRSELGLTEEVVRVLKLMIFDTDVRTRSDKDSEIYQQIDDKWLFTRTYFERLQEEFGFSRLQIYPLNPSISPFSGQLKVHLGLCLGVGEAVVSSQAWDYIRNFERKMSEDFYSELLLEGCIILTK